MHNTKGQEEDAHMSINGILNGQSERISRLVVDTSRRDLSEGLSKGDGDVTQVEVYRAFEEMEDEAIGRIIPDGTKMQKDLLRLSCHMFILESVKGE